MTTMLTLPFFSMSVWSNGSIDGDPVELAMLDVLRINPLPHDLQKQIVEAVLDEKIAKATTNFNIKPPDGPPHPKYRDGREVWKGADGSTWRYNQRSLNWIQTSEGSPK